MVVEFLTFTVPVDELETWLQVERRHWTGFLEQQTGFVRKEMWRSLEDPTSVHAVIWWESMNDWTSISQVELERVVADMGVHERSATCAAFEVLP
jgi:uncharacterized protein (TIGR03792 family)